MNGPITLPFPDRPYFGRIDALRGLGALAVAAYHVSGHGVHGRSFLPVERAMWDGVAPAEAATGRFLFQAIPAHASLMVFFVISGFVLRLAFDRGPAAFGPSLGRFLVARAFRFFPIVFAATLGGVLLARSGLPHDAAFDELTVSRFWAQVFLIDTTPIGVLWALQVELLMVPVLFLLWRLERRLGPGAVLAVAVGMMIFMAKPTWAGWRPFGMNAFAIALGATVPTFGRAFARSLNRRRATVASLTFAAILMLTHAIFGLYSRFGTFCEGTAAWAFVSLVAYRTDVAWFRLFDVRGLVSFGTWAGSVYVLHMLTIPLAVAALSAAFPPSWVATAPLATGLVCIAVWLAAVAGLAAAGFRFVESPGIRAGVRVNRTFGWTGSRESKPETVVGSMPLRKAA